MQNCSDFQTTFKYLCICMLFRFDNIRFVFELSNKKIASLSDAKCYLFYLII